MEELWIMRNPDGSIYLDMRGVPKTFINLSMCKDYLKDRGIPLKIDADSLEYLRMLYFDRNGNILNDIPYLYSVPSAYVQC